MDTSDSASALTDLGRGSTADDEIIATIDRIPRARPNVTTHDALWAQMKTLQDDVEQAKLVQQRRGFLSTQHSEALGELRRLQIELAQSMTHEEGNSGLQHYRELWQVADPDMLRQRLFSDDHFNLLDESVAKTSEKLDQIAAMIDASVLSEDADGMRRASSSEKRRNSSQTDYSEGSHANVYTTPDSHRGKRWGPES